MNRLESRRIYADPTCTNCEGVGMYYHPDGGVAHCDCHHAEKKRVLMRRAGFPAKHIGSTVAGYTPANESERQVKAIVSAWVTNYKPGCPGLYLYGPAGTGKTHLLVAIGKALVNQYAAEVCYWSTVSLINEAKRMFDKTSGVDENPFDAAAEATVLMLDDIGAERPSEWVLTELYRLINHRYNRNLTTLLTSNVNLETFEASYDSRIADRIHEMTTAVHCNGPSRRRQGAQA